MTSLLELTKEGRELDRILEDAMGEITPEIDERMNELAQAMLEKVDGYGVYLNHLEHRVKELRALKAQLDKQIKLSLAAEDRLKNYAAMAIGEGKSVEGSVFRMRVQTGKGRVEVEDESAIPERFKVAQDPKVDKAALLAALRKGGFVPGAKLARGNPYLVVS